jgi:hypothetical protein
MKWKLESDGNIRAGSHRINKDGNYNTVPSFVLQTCFFYIVTINVDMV